MSVAEQAGLNVTRLQTSEDTFSLDGAQIIMPQIQTQYSTSSIPGPRALNHKSTGVTTYVMAGISEPTDHPPCLNYKVSFSARKAITIHLPQNKNVSAVPDDISERNI